MLDLGRSFLASVERSPGQLALVDGDLRLTYGEWFERVAAVAGGLQMAGHRATHDAEADKADIDHFKLPLSFLGSGQVSRVSAEGATVRCPRRDR